MCGICGVYRFPGGPPIDADQIKALLIGVQHRGADATGVALQQGDGSIAVWKDDSIAWKAVEMQSFERFIRENLNENTQTFLGHTRAATQGNPRKMINNHPMYAGKAAIIHNGCISNDDYLFKDLKLKREAETDSDIIRAIVDAEGFTKKSIRTLNRMTGSCASAMIHPEYPGKLLLVRSGSPCVCAKVDENLMWASEKQAIHLACRQWFNWKGMYFQHNREPLLAFNPVDDDSAWLIGQDGLEWHDKFDTCHYYTAPKYAVHEMFNYKKERWDKEKKQEDEKAKAKAEEAKKQAATVADRAVDVDGNPYTWVEEGTQMVLCPNNECLQVCQITAAVKSIPLTQLRCPKCEKFFKE